MVTSSSSGKNFSSRTDSGAAAKNSEPIWAILEQTGVSFATMPPADKERIARAYAARIRSIALHLKAKLPAHIELADLLSAGTLGLMEALGKYRPDFGIRFESFADNRIKGAMLDELRRMDWFSRGLRQKIKKLEKVVREFEQEHGHAPSRRELTDITGQKREELEATLEALHSQVILSLDAIQEHPLQATGSSRPQEPYASAAFHDIIDKLGQLIDRLSEREKVVLSLYYTDEFNMKEIAQTLNITEGRVSQIHSQALAKLKKMFIREHGNLD